VFLNKVSIFNLVYLLSVFVLVACGGGGGGAAQDNFTVSTNQLNYSADIDANVPADQIVTGSVRDATTSIRVDVIINGTAVETAEFNLTGGNSGQLTVTAKNPEQLGVGVFEDQITIYVCTGFSSCVGSASQVSGSPKTIHVSYNVTATPTVRYVAPHLSQSDASGEVIIRGVGFSLLDSPEVSFGDSAALSVNVVNDTEIKASLPLLSAGNYVVNVNDSTGSIATEASLHVITEPDLGYSFIADTGIKTRILYDAKRDVMYVGNNDTGLLMRYAHSVDAMSGDPVWTSSSLAIANIHDIAFMPDGNNLLALSDKSIVHVDLNTFTQTAFASSPLSGSNVFLRQLGIANNGIGYAVPGINGSGSTFFYKYNARKRTFTFVNDTVSQGTVGVSGDGSKLYIGSKDGNTSFNRILEYNATDDAPLTILSMSETTNALPVDLTGNTLVLGIQNFLNDQRRVYKSSILQGSIPGSSTRSVNYASALSSDGNTLYSYNPVSDVLNIYDLTSADANDSFNQAASSPLSIPDSVGNVLALTMELTPFGRSLFIAGDTGIVVQPLP